MQINATFIHYGMKQSLPRSLPRCRGAEEESTAEDSRGSGRTRGALQMKQPSTRQPGNNGDDTLRHSGPCLWKSGLQLEDVRIQGYWEMSTKHVDIPTDTVSTPHCLVRPTVPSRQPQWDAHLSGPQLGCRPCLCPLFPPPPPSLSLLQLQLLLLLHNVSPQSVEGHKKHLRDFISHFSVALQPDFAFQCPDGGGGLPTGAGAGVGRLCLRRLAVFLAVFAELVLI